MLSMMLLFSFVTITNAGQDNINELTRSDSPDGLVTSIHATTEQINFKESVPSSLQKKTNSLLKITQTATPTTASDTSTTYSGTISQAGTAQFLYPINLQPGQLLQARLDGPASVLIDYDLYLYEFNMSTGNLNPTELDYSIYGTYFNNYEQGAATLSENVGTRNAITTPKAYALKVYAKTGSSSTLPFYLTVDITSNYDAYEPDENAFKAYNFAFSTGGSTLNTRSIHSSVDNDWYKITVPQVRNYDALNIKLDSTSAGYGYKAEVYGVDTGNKLVLLPHSNNNVALGTGIYYVKVSTTNQFSTSHLYNLTIKPVLRAGSITITGYNSSANGPNDYPNYNHAGTHYRVDQNSSFTVKGTVRTTDNLPVANALVSMTWTNPNWIASTGYRTRIGTAYTDQNGAYSITVTLPPSTGSISQALPMYFTHYFDYTSVLVEVAGTPVTASDNVYHFAYSLYNGGS